MLRLLSGLVLLLPALWAAPVAGQTAAPKRMLFLGDDGHHRPVERFRQIAPVLGKRGIRVTYTDDAGDLNPDTLRDYDGLLIYANIERISPAQEQALLDYVAEGGGFIPVHCASYCFLNSDKYVNLVGAQFQRHGTGVFRTTIADVEHPIMEGYNGFESWDETYEHHRHSDDRIVLEYRVESGRREPWTWVRTHGKGRVFYTAWGHDERTWGNAGFHNLLERGIRWAVGTDPSVVAPYRDRPEMTSLPPDLKPFQYKEAEIPFYPAGERWGTTGEPIRQMQRPLRAEESMKHMVTPVGFEVRLFASEPEIGKPIAMNWDERGRLWVCETVDYPNDKQPEGEGRDRIRICEDTDGDGRADRFTVFADRLSIPTSLAFAYGGLIVHQPPHTLFLRDTDGDDVADERRILFTGWSTDDTHAGPSNLQYGFDNWYYGIVGYAGFRGAVGGERHSFRTGFYRFKVEKDDEGRVAVTKLEFLRNTDNNSWGVGFSEEGQLFGSTANGNPSVHLPIPNRYYERVGGWSSSVLDTIALDSRFDPITDKVRQVDFHGRFTAGAGHALYTARTYPPEYWNRTAFVCGPTGHLVATFVIQEDGSSYRSRNAWNLLASDDEWTAPIVAEVGPDGNVWVIDWYNYIVQHNPTPSGYKTGKGNAYISDLRDKTHGRVYRVVYEKADRSGIPNLAEVSAAKIVETLRHGNLFWRRHAQRLLVERGKLDVLPALIALTKTHKPAAQARQSVPLLDEREGNRFKDQGTLPRWSSSAASQHSTLDHLAAIHALWTMHGLGALDGSHPEATAAVVAALEHPSAAVRQNAVRVIASRGREPAGGNPEAHASGSPDSSASIVSELLRSGLLDDPAPKVRLAALLALSDLPPSEQSARAVAEFLRDEANLSDRWLVDAATSAAANSAYEFLRAVASGDDASRQQVGPVLTGQRGGLKPTLRGLDREANRSQSAVRWAAAPVVARVAEHYARGGPVESVPTLLAALPQARRDVASAVIRGLERGWPDNRRPKLDREADEALLALVERLPADGRSRLVSLALRWQSQSLQQYAAELARSLLDRIGNAEANDESRLAAARQLIQFQKQSAEAVERLLAEITPQTSPRLAGGLLQAVAQSEAQAAGEAIVGSLSSMTPAVRETAIGVLLGRTEWTAALITGIEESAVQLGELRLDQQQTLAAHPDKSIAERFQSLLKRGGGLPNPDREKVLKQLLPLTQREGDAAAGRLVFKNQCAKCHVHGEEGTRIGPDLTGMAVHTKQELLTQIIDPSRNVEGNYRAYTVVTTDGRVLTGLLASENRTAVELFDTEGKKHVVLREEIAQLVASNKSVMPEGFEKQVKPEEIVDLLEFLTERGRYVPLPLEKAATIVSTQGMFFSREDRVGRLVFSDWSPKTFAGVPFHLVDPQNGRNPNVVMLYGPQGNIPPRMPKSVSLPCRTAAGAIHLLSGVSGWGYPLGEKGSVSMIVRLHYADGRTEDHELQNGIHFADYIRRVDVPGSQFAFRLRNQQIRYLSIEPQRDAVIDAIEFIKGPDDTAPIVMAVTLETH